MDTLTRSRRNGRRTSGSGSLMLTSASCPLARVRLWGLIMKSEDESRIVMREKHRGEGEVEKVRKRMTQASGQGNHGDWIRVLWIRDDYNELSNYTYIHGTA
jgi:hypothetical protein